MSAVPIKDYASAHPSQRHRRFRPGLLAVLKRHYRSLVLRHPAAAAFPLRAREGDTRLLQVEAPVPMEQRSVAPPAEPGPMAQVPASAPLTTVEPIPKSASRRSASPDLQAEIVDNAAALRRQLILQPKPDRKKAQQAIAGAMTELILLRMGIRLKGTVKARQAREEALYLNAGIQQSSHSTPGNQSRPPAPPSQPQNP